MNTLRVPSRVSSQVHLLELLTTSFADPQQAFRLFDEFLRNENYNNEFCLRLIAIAKQQTGAPWDIRRLAILMLEHQILKLDPGNISAFDFLFTQLNLKRAPGTRKPIVDAVLKEGYSTTDLDDFIPEFRRKLERLNHVHEQIIGQGTPNPALRDFIELSRKDCKLSLARYLFTPEEVVAEILRHLQVTDGAKDLDTSQPAFVEDELKRAIATLPEFEARILKRLCKASNIYWVSETTSAEINSLVEYPATSVVLVIKPPGSDIEFEIKRAGRKDCHPLNVVFARNGYTVPPSHRLDGGSMQWLLRYEAISASRLSVIYRLVHGTEAPIARYISRATIYSVPAKSAAVQTLAYFTESQTFGKGFPEMRVAMAESVAAFKAEGYAKLPELPGDLGLTAQFIGIAAPAQAILAGTSSFRLDKLATYLSPDGPQQYFDGSLKIIPTPRDARRLADSVLEEILGVYQSPGNNYESYEQYVTAAFCVAGNRARADRIYLSLVQQVAKFWGTLLAVRGYSRGESFVARNVGLKCCWDTGEWKVKIIFMDHDALVIPGAHIGDIDVYEALPNFALDETYIWNDSTSEQFAISEIAYLQQIYRVSDELCKRGQALARSALKDAYRRTQHELLANRKLQLLFSKRFIERLLDLDVVARGYLSKAPDAASGTRWKEEMERMLAAKGYKAHALERHMELMERNRSFLERNAFLFDADNAEGA